MTTPYVTTGHGVRNAWLSLALFPVAVVVAMAVGEGLLSSAGYDSGASDVPVQVRLLIGGPLVLVSVVPLLVGARLAQRARAAGDHRGLLPMVVGVTIAVVFVLQNMLAALLS